MLLPSMPVTVNGKIDRKQLPIPSYSRQSAGERYVAPRDALELQLTRIWEGVLRIRPIGVKDNFFDLGGHSLLALRMMANIRSVMGRQLPLSALFQGGTIELLAALLRRDAGSMSWDCLVELQASGSRPPLYFVHPGGGNVLCYLNLSRLMGPDQPFYAFQTPGFYGERPLYTRIENLAAHYVEALRRFQPEGPYFLGGWSLGGVVAFEMAQQLLAEGQCVGRLLVLDSVIRPPGGENLEEVEEQIGKDDALEIIESFGEALPISMEDLDRLEGQNRIEYVLKRAMEVNLIPPDIDVAQALSFLKVTKVNNQAMLNYIPRSYPGVITLFKSDAPYPNGSAVINASPAATNRDAANGWDNVAAGGVQIIGVPGDHQSMIKSPHVETLAQLISECISD
jgi:thioesterase domain-containing protein